MTVIQTLRIENIEKGETAQYISAVLKSIANISRITLLSYAEWSPVLHTNQEFLRAFVEIHSWKDTNAAYSFIKKLTNEGVIKIMHTIDPYAAQWTCIADTSLTTRNSFYKEKTTIFREVSSDMSFTHQETPNKYYFSNLCLYNEYPTLYNLERCFDDDNNIQHIDY